MDDSGIYAEYVPCIVVEIVGTITAICLMAFVFMI